MSLFTLFIVLTFTELCECFPYHNTSSVKSFIRSSFRDFLCDCIVVMKTFEKGSENYSQLEKLSNAIAKKTPNHWPSEVALYSFDEYQRKLKSQSKSVWGTCFKSMNIVVVGNGTQQDLVKLSIQYRFTKSVWLVFLNSSDAEYFQDVYLSFDSGVYIVAPEENGVISLFEVFRVDIHYPPRVNEVGRWNSEQGYRGTKIPRYKRRGDMEGINLLAGTIENWPMTSFEKGVSEEREISGFFADVWYGLQDRMNFTSTYVRSKDGTAGTLVNGTWTGLLGMAHRGEIDVLLTQLDYSVRRLAVVQHLLPMLHSRYQVFFQPKGFLLDWLALFRPFTADVWLAMLFWMLLAAFCMAIFCKLLCSFNVVETCEYSIVGSIFFVFQAISFQGSHRTPKCWACKVVFLSCYMAAAIFVPSYSAALISSLTKKTPIKPFDNLKELHDSHYSLLLAAGTASYEYFTENELDPRFQIYDKLVKPVEHLLNMKYPEEFIRFICNHPNFAFFASDSAVESRLKAGDYCYLLKFSQPLAKLHQSMALAKNSPLADAFNFNILRMQETGMIDRELHKYYPQWKSAALVDVEAVTISDTMEAFSFIFIAFGISLFLLIMEKIMWVRQNSNEKPLFQFTQ